ncbi:hypothetical protein [Chryseobacterium sp. Leaf201]|uniref:hypothetical protein n=1 Tax=Chryseobacterium sp. Leaf201 TaxID=1735672 RepID=UPI0006F57CDD|nr:hypothetical protein [Chryseobacterium sp. Leaf201]KQM36467.1 hypothetical protein ASE55_03925 [Chryseobacterium sp. Leaf201]
MSQEKLNSRNFNPLSLSLIEFIITNESIVQPEYFSIESIVEYDSKIAIAVAFNIDDELIRLEYDIDLETNSKNKSEARAKFSFVFIYEYNDFSQVVKIVDNQVKASAQLGRAIFSVSHSTVRGVLLMKLSNTVIRDFILPVTDPAMEKFMNNNKKNKV